MLLNYTLSLRDNYLGVQCKMTLSTLHKKEKTARESSLLLKSTPIKHILVLVVPLTIITIASLNFVQWEPPFLKDVISFVIIASLLSLIINRYQKNKQLIDLIERNAREMEQMMMLKKANEELQRKDRLKDEFISIASHELRSPIQPILGFADLAKQGLISQNEAWDGLINHALRLQKLSQDILDVSRIESGELTYKMEKVRLNEIVLDVVNGAKLNLNSNLSIETNIDKNDIEVEVDKGRITQTLENIINNAIKFTKQGKIKVETHIVAEENKMEIGISDTGSGIPADIVSTIFDKFVTRSVGTENQHGSGLGLFISKAIVTAHKGTISAYNNKEGGATFKIILPINKGMISKAKSSFMNK